MRKFIHTMMLILMSIAASQAQRMIPKQKGLELNAGVLLNDKISNNYYINVAMTANGKNGNYQLWNIYHVISQI